LLLQSNSPWELLPVILDFIRISCLPGGSLRLKWYGSVRHFFTSGLLEPADVRKRAGVVEVLDAFLDAQFLLVGDSGEKDMELYAALAADRPFQILGVFIRDVSSSLILAKKTEKEQILARTEFLERMRRARALIPSHIPFRVFQNPQECVEAFRALDELGIH
jgi:phosphatidate phosphatase APP1